MAVEISSIKDVRLRELASNAKIDKNGDKKLSGEEYSFFAQKAIANGATYKQVSEALDMNALERWWFDVDKVSTDGKDDGKLSTGEAAESFGKGLLNIVKVVINHPIATAATVGLGFAATALTGGAALPVIVALGAGTGAAMIGKGVYNAATAKTDAEAKAAWEGIGNGTFAVVTSALGAKSSLDAASKAGVTGARGAKDLNTVQALVRNFKVLPQALKVSGQSIKGNVLTWTTGTVHAHSNQLRGAEPYMSTNDVQAYRLNPNGTPEEILANNPGVVQVNGKYGVVDKWATQSLQEMLAKGATEEQAIAALKLDPAKVSGGKVHHLIDFNKNPMAMIYGPDNMAVCDGQIFKSSYVDTAAFKKNGALNYQDPLKLRYGQLVDATKQVPGGFKVLPVGTKVQTASKGVQTVTEGSVVTLDHAGNPYVTPIENVLKRNTAFSNNALSELFQAKMLNKIPEQYRGVAKQIIAKEVKNEFNAKYANLIELRIKAALSEKLGAKSVHMDNDYNGHDLFIGFIHNNKYYQTNSIDDMFKHVVTGTKQCQGLTSPSELRYGNYHSYWRDAEGNIGFIN